MSDSKLQSLLRQHMQAYIESTPLSVFDEIANEIYRCNFVCFDCHLVLTKEAFMSLNCGEVAKLGGSFKACTWRNVPGVAFAIVEIK